MVSEEKREGGGEIYEFVRERVAVALAHFFLDEAQSSQTNH